MATADVILLSGCGMDTLISQGSTHKTSKKPSQNLRTGAVKVSQIWWATRLGSFVPSLSDGCGSAVSWQA